MCFLSLGTPSRPEIPEDHKVKRSHQRLSYANHKTQRSHQLSLIILCRVQGLGLGEGLGFLHTCSNLELSGCDKEWTAVTGSDPAAPPRLVSPGPLSARRKMEGPVFLAGDGVPAARLRRAQLLHLPRAKPVYQGRPKP